MVEKCHEGCQTVTAANDVSVAQDWAEILELREKRRTGLPREAVRPIVARKTGVPEGKLYSLARGRLKDVSRGVLVRLGEGVLRELQDHLRRVEHDLQTLYQIGASPADGEVQKTLASRAKILEALGLDAPASKHGGEG